MTVASAVVDTFGKTLDAAGPDFEVPLILVEIQQRRRAHPTDCGV